MTVSQCWPNEANDQTAAANAKNPRTQEPKNPRTQESKIPESRSFEPPHEFHALNGALTSCHQALQVDVVRAKPAKSSSELRESLAAATSQATPELKQSFRIHIFRHSAMSYIDSTPLSWHDCSPRRSCAGSRWTAGQLGHAPAKRWPHKVGATSQAETTGAPKT